MTTVLLIALGWIVLALLVAGFAVLVVKCPVSFGAWEHEPFSPQPGRAGRSAPAAGARGATRPTIINDLARTGALQCPRPAVSHSQPSTQNPLN